MFYVWWIRTYLRLEVRCKQRMATQRKWRQFLQWSIRSAPSAASGKGRTATKLSNMQMSSFKLNFGKKIENWNYRRRRGRCNIWAEWAPCWASFVSSSVAIWRFVSSRINWMSTCRHRRSSSEWLCTSKYQNCYVLIRFFYSTRCTPRYPIVLSQVICLQVKCVAKTITSVSFEFFKN